MSRAASGWPRGGLVSFVAGALLAAAQLGASCVDGVTPDCSDPAVCAPSEGDAASSSDGSIVLPDAGPGNDASSTDADAEQGDADADGG